MAKISVKFEKLLELAGQKAAKILPEMEEATKEGGTIEFGHVLEKIYQEIDHDGIEIEDDEPEKIESHLTMEMLRHFAQCPSMKTETT